MSNMQRKPYRITRRIMFAKPIKWADDIWPNPWAAINDWLDREELYLRTGNEPQIVIVPTKK